MTVQVNLSESLEHFELWPMASRILLVRRSDVPALIIGGQETLSALNPSNDSISATLTPVGERWLQELDNAKTN